MPRPPGTPKTGGRVAGTPNKATSDIRALAQAHGPAVIRRLMELSGCAVDRLGFPLVGADSHATQVMAMKELLDRGYGRSTTLIAGDPNSPPVAMQFSWAPEPVATMKAITADAIEDDADV